LKLLRFRDPNRNFHDKNKAKDGKLFLFRRGTAGGQANFRLASNPYAQGLIISDSLRPALASTPRGCSRQAAIRTIDSYLLPLSSLRSRQTPRLRVKTHHSYKSAPAQTLSHRVSYRTQHILIQNIFSNKTRSSKDSTPVLSTRREARAT
jgi:hypothetical protein